MNRKRNHIIIIVLILLGTLELSAQDTIIVHPEQLDRLKQLIETSREDTNKVILLNEYARLCFYDLDYISGLNSTIQARNLSVKLNYLRGEGHHLYTMAVFHRQSGMERMYFVGANQILDDDKIYEFRNGSHMPIGVKDSLFDPIISNLKTVLQYFESRSDNNNGIVADILFQLYAKHHEIAAVDQANEYVGLAMAEYKAQRKLHPTIFVLLEKISEAKTFAEREHVRTYELEAIDLIETVSDPAYKVFFFNEFANRYFFNLGQIGLALEYYLKCNDVLKVKRYDQFELANCNMMAVSYDLLGNHQKAEEIFRQGLSVYQGVVERYTYDKAPYQFSGWSVTYISICRLP